MPAEHALDADRRPLDLLERLVRQWLRGRSHSFLARPRAHFLALSGPRRVRRELLDAVVHQQAQLVDGDEDVRGGRQRRLERGLGLAAGPPVRRRLCMSKRERALGDRPEPRGVRPEEAVQVGGELLDPGGLEELEGGDELEEEEGSTAVEDDDNEDDDYDDDDGSSSVEDDDNEDDDADDGVEK